jgi:hypothetical protein
VWFFVRRSRSGRPTWVCKIPPLPIEKLILNQSVLALTARTWALQNCMSLIPKMKQALRVGHDEPYDFKQLVYFE